jgi:putative permease
MKQLVRYTFVILLTLSALVALWEFREAILLFVLSLAVGATFRPYVELLVKRGLHRAPSILLVYLLALASLAGLIVIVSGPLTRELQHATDNFAIFYTNLKQEWRQSDGIQQAIGEQLPPLEALYSAIAGDQGTALFQGAVGIATGIFGLLSSFVIIVALSMYWSADRVYFERLWLSLLPAGQRTRARDIWREIENRVGAYIRSEIAQAILAGIFLFLVYSLLQLRYPTLLALVGAFAWLIPWVGAVLAIIPAFFFGLQAGLDVAILGGAATLVVLLLMEVVVEKSLFQRQQYSSVLLLVIAIAMVDAYGLLGLLIAPPLSAAIQILASRLLVKPTIEMEAPVEVQLEKLRTRLEQVKHTVNGEEPPSPPNFKLIGPPGEIDRRKPSGIIITASY